MNLFNNLTIGRKLVLIGAMLGLPLLFLLYSVVAEKSIAIDFAKRELAGNQFLTVLSGAQIAVQRATALRLDEIARIRDHGQLPEAAAAERSIARVASAAPEFRDVGADPALVGETIDSARKLLADSARLDTTQLTPRHASATAKLRSLIARVGDQSNLILDPDLDSFYCMYALVVALPELTDRLMALNMLTTTIAEKGVLSVEDRAQFMILMGQLESAHADMKRVIEASYRGNPDGRVKQALDADYRAADATLSFLSDGLRMHVLQSANRAGNAHAAAQLRDAGLAAIERLTGSTSAELDRLLRARIADLKARLWTTLSLAAMIALLALGFAASIGRGMSRSLVAMSETMTELAGSNLHVAIPGRERRDEVGAMAKAVQVFKENAIENRRLVEERARHARELEVSERKFRTLIANIPGACYRCANDAEFTIEFISDSIEDLSGYSAADFIGNRTRSFASLFHPDDSARIIREIEEALTQRQPYNIDYRILHRDGSVRWVHEKGQGEYDGDDTLRHLAGAIFDVTEHRHLQAQLAQQQQLATIGTVAATMSHELRNPLAAIRSSVAVVAVRARGKGLDIEAALERVDRNIERCARIIYDLLEFTQPRELAPVPTDTGPWLRRMLAERTLPAGVSLTSNLVEGATVSMDSGHLAQAVTRVIENAAAALTSPSWNLDASHPRHITVATSRDDSWLCLTISDTGPGIPAEVLPRVFEPMFTTRSFGSGLGLPITRQIVEQHGGTITVASPPAGGTEVTIRLPLLARQAAA